MFKVVLGFEHLSLFLLLPSFFDPCPNAILRGGRNRIFMCSASPVTIETSIIYDTHFFLTGAETVVEKAKMEHIKARQQELQVS